SISRKQAYHITAEPNCKTCQNQFFANTNIPGSDLEQEQSVSVEHCQVLCSAHPKCTYFSYSSDDFKCYLKNNLNDLAATPKDGVTSGIPAHFCQLDDSTYHESTYEGVDFRGSDIRFELMDTAELCQSKCDEDPSCQFYAYVDESFSDRRNPLMLPLCLSKLANVVSGFSLRDWKLSKLECFSLCKLIG
uniref:Apple domain-containing protein n=1 Tax=Xiphophorus couchianus TaxID=32473 RepID=A0A3B5KR76_9TELE